MLRHLVLVDHPFERAAVAEAILERLGRNAAERQRFVLRELLQNEKNPIENLERIMQRHGYANVLRTGM